MTPTMRIVPPLDITDARLVASNVEEDIEPEWSAAHSYAKGARVRVTGTHTVYESTAASNTGNPPPLPTSTWWVPVRPTNRWAAFDGSVSTVTSRKGGIDFTLRPGEIVNTLALLRLNGAAVRVRVIDPNEGTVFDRYTVLQAPPGESTWYAYFFEPIRRRDYHIESLPSFGAAEIRVEILDVDVASVGVCVIGRAQSIGLGVQAGATIGITDYSRKERDEWGQLKIVPRGYNDRGRFSLVLRPSEVDSTKTLFARYRAVPCLFVASERYQSTVIFGVYRSFEIQIAYASHSLCTIDIEGLI